MKSIFLIKRAAIFLAVFVFLSCQKQAWDNLTLPSNAVRFSSNVNGAIQTKAANASWSAQDEIGVFMVNTGQTTVVGNAVNKRYTTTAGDGNFTALTNDLIYYPEDGSNVDFISYYPYRSNISTLGTYNVNVADQSDHEDIDLLYAQANNEGVGYDNSYSAAVGLEFRHQLSRLRLTVAAPDAALGISPAELAAMTAVVTGFNTTATFNLADGTLDGKAGVAPISLNATSPGAVYVGIVLPDEITAGTVSVTFTAGTKSFVWTLSPRTFESGKSYSYNVTLVSEGVAAGVVATIVDWEEETEPEPEPEPEPVSGISVVYSAKWIGTSVVYDEGTEEEFSRPEVSTQTIPTQPGDYVFVYGIRNGTNVVPVPAEDNLTDFQFVRQSLAGAIRAGSLHYFVATGTSTELGRWINANGLAVAVVRGVKADGIIVHNGHNGDGVNGPGFTFPVAGANFNLGDRTGYILGFASSSNNRNILSYSEELESLFSLEATETARWLGAAITKVAYTEATKPATTDPLASLIGGVFNTTGVQTIRIVVALEPEVSAP